MQRKWVEMFHIAERRVSLAELFDFDTKKRGDLDFLKRWRDLSMKCGNHQVMKRP